MTIETDKGLESDRQTFEHGTQLLVDSGNYPRVKGIPIIIIIMITYIHKDY